jgi:glycine cleavage system H protein
VLKHPLPKLFDPFNQLNVSSCDGGAVFDEMLELTVDKFTFRVPKGVHFSEAGVWIKLEDGLARLGLADFVQQRSGDMAFAEVKPVGTSLQPGDEFASIETIKVNVILPSPLTGKIVDTNRALEETPELINQDPYGKGWLAVVQLTDWDSDKARLLSADAYYALIKQEAESEVKR